MIGKVGKMNADAEAQAVLKCAEAGEMLDRAAETRESQWMLAAINLYAEAMELAPDLIEPYLALGELWLYYEQPEQARPFVRKALDLEPFDPRAQRLWADLKMLLPDQM